MGLILGTNNSERLVGMDGMIDSLFGLGGNDTLEGLGDNDLLDGGAGNDSLLGGLGRDSLNGAAGDDRLIGGGGNDNLQGGPGFDRILEFGNFNFTLSDNRLLGNGTDILGGIEAATLVAGNGNNTIDASDFSGSTLLIGLNGNDVILGGSGADSIRGGNDNDSLRGNDGNDTIQGDSGDDTLIGGTGNDELNAGLGNDFVFGGDGNDRLLGSDGNDTLAGGINNDTLTGGQGNDQLFGGPGIDRIFESGNVNFILTDTQLIGKGTDTLTTIERATLRGGSGNNILNASGFSGPVILAGLAGNDLLFGGSSSDYLAGNQGNDTVIGGGGNDYVLGTGATAAGVGERDVLTSGLFTDQDRFVLGEGNTEYYKDPGAASLASYARITDFDIFLGTGSPAQADRIQLEGVAGDYRLGTTTVDGQTGVGIFFREGTNQPGDDDLIGLVQGPGVTVNQLNLTNGNQFIYV